MIEGRKEMVTGPVNAQVKEMLDISLKEGKWCAGFFGKVFVGNSIAEVQTKFEAVLCNCALTKFAFPFCVDDKVVFSYYTSYNPTSDVLEIVRSDEQEKVLKIHTTGLESLDKNEARVTYDAFLETYTHCTTSKDE